MSTNNAARFYWAKLKSATALFEKEALEEAEDECCQLGNEYRCPGFCQIEVWKLRSRCFTDNHWFAKAQLDHALEVMTGCESNKEADEQDMAALAEVKEGVEKMLVDREAEYREYWENVRGRDPPSMDEWYDIVEGEDDEDGGGEEWVILKDENGNDMAGVVGDWPFLGPGMLHQLCSFATANTFSASFGA
jgi:hypothetical protein